MKKIFTSLLCGLITAAAFGQWSPTSMHGERTRTTSNVKTYYTLDLKMMRAQLGKSQETGRSAAPVEIKIPTLNGKIERFAVYSAPVVVRSLQDRYQLGSYVGVGIDDPAAYVRFSIAPNDFQSMVFRNGAYEFIEPQNTDKTVYGVHPKSNKTEADKAFVCSTGEAPLTKKEMDQLYQNGKSFANNPADFSKASDRKYRTMRLAMTTNAEYTNYFGGVAGAMVAINATLTRVNGVFEKDFGLHLILQDFPGLIYTNPATDPFTAATPDGTPDAWNLETQKAITTLAGEANYDIGHMFGAFGGGGNAGCIGCVCVSPSLNTSGIPTNTRKGSAYTAPADGIPKGDSFDIDYVAHEIGHQLGGTHTFSFQLEGSGQNVEPGSGSTIMGYAGITGATDVQPNSDAYFHVNSIIQVQNNLIAKTCDIETPTVNNPPVITPMTDLTIPKGTAFVLSAEATDAENDQLIYTWEQVDNASTAINKNNLGLTTSGASFRSILGSASPIRFFPKFETVMAGLVSNPEGWESVSAVARTSNFRVTVRDNNPDITQQQTESALQKVIVSAKGPFKITSSKVYNNAPVPFTWDVVGTNAAPFNAANVKIDYTTDNGASWITMVESTENDGTEDLNFVGIPTDTVLKMRISAIGNVFYTVAPVKVFAVAPCDGAAPTELEIASITPNSAVVSWKLISGGTYVLRYKASMSSAWTVVPLTSDSYTLTDLDDSTTYDIEVAAVCAGTTGNYAVKTFTTLMVPYCPLTSESSEDEYISNVTITAEGAAGVNNSSGASKYTDYSNDPVKVVKLMANTTNNTISVTKAWPTSIPYNDAITVWIDFDRSGTYEANEMVLSTSPDKISPVTNTFSVPANAYKGPKSVGMRVALRYDAKQVNPCGLFNYGEVEDYAVNILENSLTVKDNKAQQVQVYPNPAIDVLNITKVTDKATYSIYNMAGQAVSNGKIINNKVQVSQLQKGVYVIAINDNGEVTKVKFIKK